MAKLEDVFFVAAGGTDRYGDPEPSPEEPRYAKAIVLPRKSSELYERGITIRSGYEMFVKPPPPFEVKATDTVIVRGEEQQIDGVPGLYIGKALQVFTEKIGS